MRIFTNFTVCDGGHPFIEGDCDPSTIKSNTFTMEWPPKSGKQMAFPEVDRAEFFNVETAKTKINAAQVGLLEELVQKLRNESRSN